MPGTVGWGKSRLVCDEDRERWVRAPPNCNPFDARASFSCSSISCRAARDAAVQATYGRSRLNTATGVERPSYGGDSAEVGSGSGSHSTKRVCHSTDCRQHVDGCFSSRTRWSPSLDTNPERNAFAHPVVYVPIRLEMCAKSPIHPTTAIHSEHPNSAVRLQPTSCGSPLRMPANESPLQTTASDAHLHFTSTPTANDHMLLPQVSSVTTACASMCSRSCCTATAATTNGGHPCRSGACTSTASSSSTSSHS
ncbi:hypothetical protein Tcan_14915 [Toxocara canis]|uniref:Uncharacterized protein n=1 Tax=Toxocara canis TaxID=6265 RepID=A0A0B2V6M8_TOXCA|nr:hypothetical protein Tcan_14915 [Toxocara canis]